MDREHSKDKNFQSFCCGYGALGMANMGYDCVMIPGATKYTGKTQKPVSICGNGVGLVTATSMIARTVCSKSVTFNQNSLQLNAVER